MLFIEYCIESVLNTVLKVKNRMVASLSAYPRDHVLDCQLHLIAAAQHHRSIILHIARLRKDQSSKFKVQFLLNVLLLLHHHKSNHRKLGTVRSIIFL